MCENCEAVKRKMKELERRIVALEVQPQEQLVSINKVQLTKSVIEEINKMQECRSNIQINL